MILDNNTKGMFPDVLPQHVECNVVNYNNPSYEDGYLSDSVSNCSFSTIAQSDVVEARIKRHEQHFLNQQSLLKEFQNNNSSDKYQVVNITVDKLHIYGDKESNQQSNQDFELPIKGAINGILNTSSNYETTWPVVTDNNSPKRATEIVTSPVNQHNEIKKAREHLAILIIVALFITMTAVLLLLRLKGNDDIKLDSTVEGNKSLNLLQANALEPIVFNKRLENIDQLETISRDSWTSIKYIIGKHKQLNPIQRIIVMETGDVSCTTIKSCKQFLQHKQNKDYPKADDIKENFFVGYDGTIYEGRGWSREGQHTYDSAGTSYNSQAIGISLIGNFTKKPPNELQWNATVLFLEKAVNDTKLDVDYKVFHQKQLIGGIDDNNKLYNATKMLNNWKSTPEIIHRNEWGATVESKKIKTSSVPMKEVIVRNVGKFVCKTKNSCVNILEDIPKTNHTMDNFIFGGNNFTFEGKSFDDNQGSLFIGYIPENSKIPLNVTKLEEFLDYAVDLGKLDKNYTIYYK